MGCQLFTDPCGREIRNRLGEIRSYDRNGDGLYDKGENCWWNITVENGTVVQLKFLSVDIPGDQASGQCDTDYIMV